MRVLDFIHAGQARFLDECGSWVGIAGKVCCDFGGEYASSVLTRRGCRMSRPSGACLLGDRNDDVPALSPKVWRTCHRNGGTASVRVGFSG